MVLPHRIELWTSPLPRGCSTTELRQHVRALRAGGLRITDHRRRVEKAWQVAGRGLMVRGMNERIPAERTAAEKARQTQRQARLARQLRENLKRRKAQMRSRAVQPADGEAKRGG